MELPSPGAHSSAHRLCRSPLPLCSPHGQREAPSCCSQPSCPGSALLSHYPILPWLPHPSVSGTGMGQIPSLSAALLGALGMLSACSGFSIHHGMVPDCQSRPFLSSALPVLGATSKEEQLCSFSNGFSFPPHTEKGNCVNPAPSAASSQEQRQKGCAPPLPVRTREKHTKPNRNMKFYVLGATSGHHITAAACAAHSPVPELSTMTSRPWNLGSRDAAKMGVWGCCTWLPRPPQCAAQTNPEGQQSAGGVPWESLRAGGAGSPALAVATSDGNGGGGGERVTHPQHPDPAVSACLDKAKGNQTKLQPSLVPDFSA